MKALTPGERPVGTEGAATFKAWTLKNRSAWANTSMARTLRPLTASSSVSMVRSCSKNRPFWVFWKVWAEVKGQACSRTLVLWIFILNLSKYSQCLASSGSRSW